MHQPGPGLSLGTHIALQSLLLFPTLPERDLPDPLDQKIITWETVQKENFLSTMEKRRRDSQGEVLRKTAHRWGRLWDSKHMRLRLAGAIIPVHKLPRDVERALPGGR